MKKSLLGWALAATLTACGGTQDAEPNIVTGEDGTSVILQEGDNVSREPDAFSSENPQAMPMGAGCWVVLDWCRDPDYGLGICHQNGQCTQKQFRDACISLYKKNC